ncbi:MAG: acyl-CoA dehydrogenase family protein [Candidatus Methylomirabilis sp.]|nr:acyl-CoA dehydrogenase family protein [Deltaproteobacteria bacterium]
MDLSFTPEQIRFREECRAFIEEAMTPRMRRVREGGAHWHHEDIVAWQKILYKKGWAAPHWPVALGGTGWDAAQRFIWSEECARASTPPISPFGLGMVGPLLIQFGTEAQKKRYLPKILAAEEIWCQGYSEPNSGSDLASLQLRAEEDGRGSFVLNGQKTWTTYAQYADWIFVLARTDPNAKKQAGISFLLCDMKTPGVEVRPFLTTGGEPSFCETFFENVKVPRENLVGPLHGGWTMAKALLGHERTLITAVPESRRWIRLIKRIARDTGAGGRRLLDDPLMRARIARHEIRHKALQMANLRTLAAAQLGHAPGPESSILKIRGTEILQQGSELAMEAMGANSMTWFNEDGAVPPEQQWIPNAFNYHRAASIYGGTNEIQRNIIAKMILGLPSA